MTTGTGLGVHVLGRFVAAIVCCIDCIGNVPESCADIRGNHFRYRERHVGAPIPGVSITVKHPESGLRKTVVSCERGGYNVCK